MSADDGGSAFPRPDYAFYPGMSLRDHFAAQALAGLCANPGGPFQASAQCGWSLTNCSVDDVAMTAYHLADAMIKERSK